MNQQQDGTEAGRLNVLERHLHENLSLWKRVNVERHEAIEERVADACMQEVLLGNREARLKIFQLLDEALQKLSLDQSDLPRKLERLMLLRLPTTEHRDKRESSG